jgi:hypothetical protein
MKLNLSATDKKIMIAVDGESLGEMKYVLRSGKDNLSPDEVVKNSDNIIKAVFKEAEIEDEFEFKPGLIRINRSWKILKPGRWQLKFNYSPGHKMAKWIVPVITTSCGSPVARME